MMLLETFLELCSRWRPVFTQDRTFELAMRQALGTLKKISTQAAGI